MLWTDFVPNFTKYYVFIPFADETLFVPTWTRHNRDSETASFVSHLDISIQIHNGKNSDKKTNDKREDLNFPIVNYPFIKSNTPEARAYCVYIAILGTKEPDFLKRISKKILRLMSEWVSE